MKIRNKMMLVGLTALMAVAMTACGKGKAGGNEIDLKNTTYEMEKIQADGIEGDIQGITRLDDRIYVHASKYTDTTKYPSDWVNGEPPEGADESVWDDIEYTHESKDTLFSMAPDGSDVKKVLTIDTGSEGADELRSCTPTRSGEIYVLYAAYDEATETHSFRMEIYDEAGKKQGEVSLTDLLEPGEYITRLQVDKEGRIYLMCDERVLVIDAEGKELFSAKGSGYIGEMIQDREGSIYVSTFEDGKRLLKKVDPQAKGFSSQIELTNGASGLYDGGGDYDFYFDDGSNLTGFMLDGSSKILLNWVGSNIIFSNLNRLTALEDGNFIGWYQDIEEDEEGYLVLLKKVDPSQVADQTVIVFGGLYLNEQVKKQAVTYNKSQNKYRIVLRDYSGEDDPEGRMNADILAGDVPDILDLSSAPVDKYISKGMLLDLYPLIDQDPELKREDFIDNILKALEKDGKLYYISPTFNVSTLAASKKDVGDKKALTIDDLTELESKHKGSRAFSSLSSNSRVLDLLCRNNFDQFIDWTTGKCSFDSEDFVKMLEYAGTYPDEEKINYDDDTDLLKDIKDKKTLFMETYGMTFEDVEMYNQVYGEDVAFIGLPSADKGIGIDVNSMVGIYAKSPNVEGAWDFYRTMLTREYIGSPHNYLSGLPLRKDAYEDQEKKVTTTEKYTDDFGNEVLPLQSTWGFESMTIDIKPLTKEQAQMMRDVIAAADHKVVYNPDLMDIITEEAGAYFSGAKSAKETAGIIQNRVSTYVNENR